MEYLKLFVAMVKTCLVDGIREVLRLHADGAVPRVVHAAFARDVVQEVARVELHARLVGEHLQHPPRRFVLKPEDSNNDRMVNLNQNVEFISNTRFYLYQAHIRCPFMYSMDITVIVIIKSNSHVQ